MENTPGAGEQEWSSQIHAHERALQDRDPKALAAAHAELLHRGETYELNPGEAQLLDEIKLAMGSH